MKKLISLVISLVISTSAFGWGSLGHQIVGEIAEKALSSSAKRKLKTIMGRETLAKASLWPDEVKSEAEWDYAKYWHFVSIADYSTYDRDRKHPKGDIVKGLQYFVDQLTNRRSTSYQKKIAIRFIVHFVGDFHQPLHIGKKEDRGGNDIKFKWNGNRTNLHSIWDHEMINGQNLTLDEYVSFINHVDKYRVLKWQKTRVRDWLNEGMHLRKTAYKLPNMRVSNWEYKYTAQHIKTINKQMLKAGFRLAALLENLL
jgi:hypothetical protein